MTDRADQGSRMLREQAADWVARLSADAVGEADWLQFKAWLDAEGEAPGEAEARRGAFDEVQALWLALDEVATPSRGAGVAPRARRDRGRRTTVWRRALPAAAAVAAAAGFAIVFGVGRRPAPQAPAAASPVAKTYVTAVGDRRSIRLPDGGLIELDGGSRLSVAYASSKRLVRLEAGEAVFDVVHDPSRPFIVDAGLGQVRVLGTAFDVARADGEVRVAVSRGLVRFSAGGQSVGVSKGRAAAYAGGLIRIAAVDPATVGGWRQGWRVYRDQPLTTVVEDLGRQFPRPLRIGDARAGRLRFTGALVVDNEAATVRRLTALLPIRAREENGATVLSSR
jgi:transmembrane sensor